MIPLRDTIRSERTPYVTYAILATNVLVHLWVEVTLSPAAFQRFVFEWGLVPRDIRFAPSLGELSTFATSMFLHGSWLHLGGNMLYLWIFGDNVEDRMGHVPFLGFYIACGLAAAGSQFVIDPDSEVPMVGASGAIAGVLGAYLIVFPHSKVLTLIPIFYLIPFAEISAFWFLIIWLGMQLLWSTAVPVGVQGGVAYWAHIGGFIAGAAIAIIFRGLLKPSHPVERPRPSFTSSWDLWDQRRQRSRDWYDDWRRRRGGG